MTVSSDFSFLNQFRPAKARFGEVVSIELFVDGHYRDISDDIRPSIVGVSKRKSVHVPPSSNAYWNFMNLRADFIRAASTNGTRREDRWAVVRLINLGVRAIHYHELCAAYGHYEELEMAGYPVYEGDEYGPVQYYQLIIRKDVLGWSASIKGLQRIEPPIQEGAYSYEFLDMGPVLA